MGCSSIAGTQHDLDQEERNIELPARCSQQLPTFSIKLSGNNCCICAQHLSDTRGPNNKQFEAPQSNIAKEPDHGGRTLHQAVSLDFIVHFTQQLECNLPSYTGQTAVAAQRTGFVQKHSERKAVGHESVSGNFSSNAVYLRTRFPNTVSCNKEAAA